jgi:glycolate oxidase FAD binding subunit
MQNIEELQTAVASAAKDKRLLSIVGGGTKSFYGREVNGEPLSMAGYSGVIEYQPTELVITAKAGTPLEEIQRLLSENNQRLGFEAPDFGKESTLGGVVATGLCGPSRPYVGAIEDYVLGVKLLSGSGEVLSFGGKVIKNVAGFDVSRLMVGALGCLGIILEISLKVVPIPETEETLVIAHDRLDESIHSMNQFAGNPVPISAATWCTGLTRIRLSGSENGVSAAIAKIKSQYDCAEDNQIGSNHWVNVQNLTHDFFKPEGKLYRVSVAPSTKSILNKNECLVDWGGALRWYREEVNFQALSDAVSQVGGHVSVFRNGDRSEEVLAPVTQEIMKLHQRLKNTFDPARILNSGRMYKDI